MIQRVHLQKIIDESRQLITDAQYWNDSRTDEEPVDCESERVMLRLAETAARHLDDGDSKQTSDAVTKLVLYAERMKGADDDV